MNVVYKVLPSIVVNSYTWFPPFSLILPIVDRKMFVFRASEAHIRSVAASNDNNDVHHSHLKFLHTLQSCVQTNIWWWHRKKSSTQHDIWDILKDQNCNFKHSSLPFVRSFAQYHIKKVLKTGLHSMLLFNKPNIQLEKNCIDFSISIQI